MSDSNETGSVFTPSWINVVNPNEIIIRQQFEGRSFQINMGDDLADTTCCFKSFDGVPPGYEHMLLFDSQHGSFALDNGREFFQALLGIPFTDMDLSTFSKTLSVHLASLPEPFASVFGWVSPNFFSNVKADLFCATLQLQARDCTITNTMMAPTSLWMAMLSSPELVKTEDENSNIRRLKKVNLPVVLGRTKLNKQELSDLLPGDIFCLDESLFQADNQGIINLGSNRVFVEWVSRGEIDVLKVKELGERPCKQ